MDSILAVQQQCMTDSENYFPDTAHDLPYFALCLAGEVGEFCNILKKVERGSLEYTSQVHLDLAMEATDVFIYLMNIAALLHINIGAAYDHKRARNNERFGHPSGGVSTPLRSTDGEGI